MRFLFVDRITELTPGVVVRGVKHVTRDDYYLCQDRQGAWCFIPTLMGEALGQLAAWNVMLSNEFVARPVAGIAECASLYRPAYVGETLLLEAHIDRLDSTAVQYHGEVRVGREVVFQLEGALGPLLPMADFVDTDVVRRQFKEIDRPLSQDELLTLDGSFDKANQCVGGAHTPPMVFDRVMECEPGVRLTAVKLITRAASYFPDHFPNKPVLPMTVLLACFLNLANEFIAQAGYPGTYVCSKMRRVKMSDFISPGDVVTGVVTQKSKTERELVLICRCDVAGKRVGVLELVMAFSEQTA